MARLVDIPMTRVSRFLHDEQTVGVNPMLIERSHADFSTIEDDSMFHLSTSHEQAIVKSEEVSMAGSMSSPLFSMASNPFCGALPSHPSISPVTMFSPGVDIQSEEGMFSVGKFQGLPPIQAINSHLSSKFGIAISSDALLPSMSSCLPSIWPTEGPVSPRPMDNPWSGLPALTPDLGASDPFATISDPVALGQSLSSLPRFTHPHFFDHQIPESDFEECIYSDMPICGGPVESSSPSEPPSPPSMMAILKEFASTCPYRVSLNARTAYIRSDERVPLTYLNKFERYQISVRHQNLNDDPHGQPFDSPFRQSAERVPVYRSCVRVTFDEAANRVNPEMYWNLFRETRIGQEGSMSALQFVLADPSVRSHAELETTWFDGFAVRWHPVVPQAQPTCSIPFKFRFLSTDFSRSKGVKGIVVRLCVKTQLIGTMDRALAATRCNTPGLTDEQRNNPPIVRSFPDHQLFDTSTRAADLPPPLEPYMSYCRVRVFRDHGAERKVSNDKKQIEKWMGKAREMLGQVCRKERETGVFRGKKRKCDDMAHADDVWCHPRSSSWPSTGAVHRRVAHRRNSDDSVRMGSLTPHWGPPSKKIGSKAELVDQIDMYNMMLRSRFDDTVFTYRASEADDPELHPFRYNIDFPGSRTGRRVPCGVDDRRARSGGSPSEPTKPGLLSSTRGAAQTANKPSEFDTSLPLAGSGSWPHSSGDGVPLMTTIASAAVQVKTEACASSSFSSDANSDSDSCDGPVGSFAGSSFTSLSSCG